MSLEDFDLFVEEGGYTPDQTPQAFADWLASRTGGRIVGMSEAGVVESEPAS